MADPTYECEAQLKTRTRDSDREAFTCSCVVSGCVPMRCNRAVPVAKAQGSDHHSRRECFLAGGRHTVLDVLTYLEIEADASELGSTIAGLQAALGDRAYVLAATDDDSAAKRWVRINVDVLDADEWTSVETLREAIGVADIDRNVIAGPAFLSAV
jgi:hypothetical protein